MRVDEGVMMPRRATTGSAGYDFYAPEDIELRQGFWTEVGTGVYLEDGDKATIRITQSSPYSDEMSVCVSYGGDMGSWCMLLFPRSGLGHRYGVRMANTIGVIDQDYRGEIRAKLTCEVDHVVIRKGERFMQGVVIPFGTFVDEIEPTKTRDGGFGSTGA